MRMRLDRVIEILISIYLCAIAAYLVSLALRGIWLMWAG